ncbi:Crp/Fnr family transcriptional regulator [Pedobacter sp. AW1-32]|uniref:Crp/Fnr family transcriptional regulator n=1 Tax=Pedobacter sp. AW1-32 TaxID=3383026 RepID=UPI003FEEFA25
MYAELHQHIKRFVDLSGEEEALLSSLLKSFSFKKKELLLNEGQVCRANYFVVKGCLRMYFIDIKGAEQTIQFAIENWWMSDHTSLQFQNASQFYIQATEAADVIAIEHHQQEELFNKLPKLERYFRLVLQKSHSAAQMRIKYLYSMTGEERYRQFAHLFPEFIQRIPQYMLASYLGFTPEFLSKIRAKK